MQNYGTWLIRIAAVYALIGALIGSDLAGRKDYTMVPGHAHILVVGWLSLFAYGIFYHVFKEIGMKRTARLQAWTSLLGGGLMPLSMLIYYKSENTFTTLFFILTASVLLLAIILFTVLVFFDKKIFARN
jgi:cbb3-type cytochrome oxidase subunit 3